MALPKATFLKLLTKDQEGTFVNSDRCPQSWKSYKRRLSLFAVLSFFWGEGALKAGSVSARGGKLRDQHKMIDDLENERKKRAILSLILSVILIVFGIAVVVAFFN